MTIMKGKNRTFPDWTKSVGTEICTINLTISPTTMIEK